LAFLAFGLHCTEHGVGVFTASCLCFPFFLGWQRWSRFPTYNRTTSAVRPILTISRTFAHSLEIGSKKNHQFPANESEFKKALGEGPAAWHFSVGPAPTSRYRQRGRPLPYQIVVVTKANGPRVTDISLRPGVIYYCVSSDLQEFWVTMTMLQTNLSSAASLQPFADLKEEKYWIIHAAGHDFPVKKP
jgi:hypothetical protein